MEKKQGKEQKRCCANCDNCHVERPFGQQEWYVCACDVNGPDTIETIKRGIITTDINVETDCFAWLPKGYEAPDIVSMLFDARHHGKKDLIWKRLGLGTTL